MIEVKEKETPSKAREMIAFIKEHPALIISIISLLIVITKEYHLGTLLLRLLGK